MTKITLQSLTHRFSATALALDDVSIEIHAGELFFLLGPSGCGKSTLLRIVSGLLSPTSGKVLFNGADVTHLPTDLRNAVMCFQSYALWPHMTVRQNVAFGLEVRKIPSRQREFRVDEVLKLVRLEDYAARKPNELSGGQQQRVALARALAVHPASLLLDEPLSNLDARLRLEMRTEIRRICKASGFTTLYVTHDQKEALSAADRIAVLKDGKLMQVGTPAELYLKPNSVFVAEFIGQTNLIDGEVASSVGGDLKVQTSIGIFVAQGAGHAGKKVKLSIRPEHIRIHATADGSPAIAQAGDALAPNISVPFRLCNSAFLGENSEHLLQAGNVELKAIASPPLLHDSGNVTISVRPQDIVVLDR